jgi:hypothetical protein
MMGLSRFWRRARNAPSGWLSWNSVSMAR